MYQYQYQYYVLLIYRFYIAKKYNVKGYCEIFFLQYYSKSL